MAQTDTWMPLYVADYIKDTRHLSTAEHGAYLLLILHAWTNDGLIPSDKERLRRITGLSAKEWKSAFPVLEEFFFPVENGYRNKRVDAELAKASDIVSKRRAAANARWAKQEDSNSNANAYADDDAEGMQRILPSQSPSHTQEESKPKTQGKGTTLHPEMAFSGRVVRLNQRDFDAWSKAYSAIPDLRADLMALDDWMRDQGNDMQKKWFHIVSGALSKKHQKYMAEAKKDEGPRPLPKFTSPA